MTFKTIALALAASTAFASTASADAFTFNNTIEGSTAELGQISAPGAGVVSLYDFHRGVQGELLGTQEVTAGANYDVRVNLGHPAIHDVVAVLTVDGQVVDTQELDVVR